MNAVSPSIPPPQFGDEAHVPQHVAIIMDGNGRWARARGLARTDGHRAGVEAARRTLEAARDVGLRYLTLYSFSTENWRRPAGEVRDLMGLLKQFIIDDLPKLKSEGVRIRILGDKENLTRDIKMLVNRAERETADNSDHHLQIAFNYGGRDEIVRAAQAIATAVQAGDFSPAQIDERLVCDYLDTKGMPDPDLVIRTSGEKRISNYLIWQAAYAEYVFPDVLWPDFDEGALRSAIEEFNRRERRFGGVDAVTK